MKNAKKAVLCFASLFLALGLYGCGKKEVKVDETKPLEQIRAEVKNMNVNQLKAAATKYKEALDAKNLQVKAFSEKIKSISPAELMSDRSKAILAELDELNKSFTAIKERFDIYYQQLRSKGGDLKMTKSQQAIEIE